MKVDARVEGISDDGLLGRVGALVGRGNRLTAELLVYLAEVERRGLHLVEGCSSLFSFCVERLRMAEGAAYKRVWAARIGRRFPVVLEMIAAGEIHLTGVHLLARHLTEENHVALLARARHRTKREIEKLVAEIAPRPDVASRVAAVPRRRAQPIAVGSSSPELATDPDPTFPPAVSGDCGVSQQGLAAGTEDRGGEGGPAPAPELAPAVGRPASIEPLSPLRYLIRVTVGEEAHGALRQLQDLMAHQVPDGDPAVIIEEALLALLEKKLARKAAVTRRPRASSASATNAANAAGRDARPEKRSRSIPAPIRRAVWERDGGRCAHVDARGRRCGARRFVEFHHLENWARGGAHSVETIELRCRAHNQYQAERDYGPAFMVRKRSGREGAREVLAALAGWGWGAGSEPGDRPL